LPAALTGSLTIMEIALGSYYNMRPQLLALALADLKQSIIGNTDCTLKERVYDER